ncbi:MAG TPA: signal peptide peptidase SppA [Candidatus Binataceae bacterium]|nr:signal peptide peptidase SppA [Candidatus Binataceae bacterium]
MRRLVRWMIRAVVVALILLVIALVSDRISHRIPIGSTLEVTLTGPVVERGDNGVLGLLNTGETPLNTLRRAIANATTDPRIAGLSIKVIDPDMDFAQAQELAGAIQQFRAHGKWTEAYLETAGESGPGNLPYLVAASAEKVSLMPQGEIGMVGVGVRELFARGTLDWLGVRPQFAALGKYKSAANIFTEKDFTEGQREEDDSLVSEMYDQIVAAVSDERHLDAATVKGLIDKAPLNAPQSLSARLVDRLEYEDQYDDRIRKRGGDHDPVSYFDYARPSAFGWFSTPDRIAVVYGVGEIDRSSGGINPLNPGGGDTMTSDDLVKAFQAVRDNDSIHAVVFRVNSPGGSVIASELIRREVELTAKKKPVVVSMSGYAASGGYWVSTPAAKMIAEPGTITGSIGVLGGKFNIAPAASKVFLNSGAVERGANVGMFDEFTDFTPAQEQQFRDQMLGDTYQYFLKLVAASRHLGIEDVDQIAQGRVWTGRQALGLKLVDALGGMDDAIAAAKALAKIPAEEHVALVEYPQEPSLFELLRSGRVPGVHAFSASTRVVAPIIEAFEEALRGRTLVRAAYCPVVPLM